MKFAFILLLWLGIFIWLLEGSSAYLCLKDGNVCTNVEKLERFATQYSSKTDSASYALHPYFGYTYFPNQTIFQGEYNLKTNSDGFVDEEFPLKKEPGICNIGLLGGSGAMGWGAPPGGRLDEHLEKILNGRKPTTTCRSYKVLNLGIGSHFQYQASQIFFYYAHLLDAAIFYGGNNECFFDEGVLNRAAPLRFPRADMVYAAYNGKELQELSKRLYQKTFREVRFFLDHPQWLNSKTISWVLGLLHQRRENRIREATLQLDNKAREQGKAYFKNEAKERFSDLYDGDIFRLNSPVNQQAMKRILPWVYTEPLKDTLAISRQRKIPILIISPPTTATLNKPRHWGSYPPSKHAEAHKSCHEFLKKENEKLKLLGVQVIDLNDPSLFERVEKSIFIDNTHLSDAGNAFVASYLSRLMSGNQYFARTFSF